MDKPKTCPNVESGDGPKGPESEGLLPFTEIQAEVEYGLQPFGRGTCFAVRRCLIAMDIPPWHRYKINLGSVYHSAPCCHEKSSYHTAKISTP